MKNLSEIRLNIQKQGIKRFLEKLGKKHFVITGTHTSGKSEFFREIMMFPAHGIRTYAIREGIKKPKCIIMENIFTGQKEICALPSEMRMERIEDVFESLGVNTLKEAMKSPGDLVFVDEIGFLEENCSNYRELLLQLFEMKCMVCVLKKENSDLQKQILARNDIYLLDLDEYYCNEVVGQKIGCVILASGISKRFENGFKLLHPFLDKPLIEHTLEKVPKNDFDKCVVVTRSHEIKAISEEHSFEVILHDKPFHSDSMKMGLEHLSNMDALMFCVADKPLCSRRTYEKIIRTAKAQNGKIIRLYCGATPSNPVIFPRRLYRELARIDGKNGGNTVIRNHENLLFKVQCEHPYETIDVDTLEDLRNLEQTSTLHNL